MSTLCLIHTADLHNHLTAAKAARLGELKAGRQALLLDSGDALGSPNLVARPWRERAITLMNRAGYDAMCVGNREYGLTRGAMRAKTGHAAFPVLSANLVPCRRALPHLARWTVLTAPGGVRVGLFGLSVTLLEPGSFWERVAAYRYLPPLEAAAEAVDALRAQVDVLLALTHYGRREEESLASALPQLDGVLCGHWHEAHPSLTLVGRTAVARTFAHARGAAILTYDAAGWRQESMEL